ncbi:beta-mannosidase [Butyrivibrio proteoclasticus]|uniref:beta-mannosidase n=1 Tax=Butyrivibrio proteoclasticus TaxID=43305 RepID=UPI00047EFA73|nr:glycoside hydrolase family 2 protein [Butyrivibrio proteoclasticus]
MYKYELKENWKMGKAGDAEQINAVVPGSVYTDLLREGKMEDPFWKDNEDKALKLMDNDYEYVCSFKKPAEAGASEFVLLRFDGLDTLADVTLNGQLLGSTNNMHRVWEFDVKELLKDENELKVLFHSPTKFIEEAYAKAPTRGTEDAMPGFVHIRKAHCMFGWDWGAHLPDAGIYRPVTLLCFDKARLESVNIFQDHSKVVIDKDGNESGEVTLTFAPYLTASDREDIAVFNGMTVGGKKLAADWVNENYIYEVTVTAPDGTSQSRTFDGKRDSSFDMTITNPKLWWPNGYGQHPLYSVEVVLKDESGKELDSWSRRIGLRRSELSTAADQWGNEFCFVINGVKIFSMGADYIPEDHLLGRVNDSVTRKLLEKAAFANHNSIRVWGGGYYPEDYFFDICDELGILVWEDFMFACAVYDLTTDFEDNIRHEIRDNIIRLRHHASLGLMCGNNEMEMFVKQGVWVSKPSEAHDYTIMYEYILPKMMKEYAPYVTYWPASPSSGGAFDEPNDENRGDVHYWDVWHGNKPFSEYRKFHFRFLSEFGFQAFPSMKTIETFTDNEEDMNPFSYIMEKHQRNGAANGKIMNYMQQTYRYPSDFSTFIYASQMLQADAIRYGVEHFRRNRGRCMGAVVWQLNDCWPVASWSSIDYSGRLKALHYAEKRFFAPILVSCEEQGEMTNTMQLNWLPREIDMSAKFSIANETRRDVKATLKWALRKASGEVIREGSEELSVPALSSVWTGEYRFDDADRFEDYVSYEAVVGGEVVSSGTVLFTMPKYFKYENPKLAAVVDGNKITVSSSAYARGVEILNENEDLILSDNYFDLNGDSKTVEVISGDVSKLRLRSVYDIR